MLNLQNLNWKKIALIIGFIVIIAVVAYLIYYLFFRELAPEAPEEVPPEELAQLPPAEEGLPPGLITPEEEGVKLPSEKVLKVPVEEEKIDAIAQGGVTKVQNLDYSLATNITLDDSGDNIYSYNPDSGKFYEITSAGDKRELSSRVYKDVQTIAWAPKKDQAILEFPDSTNILYNFEKDKQITLPKDWTDFNFSSTGSQIAFKDMNQNADYRWIAIANTDGSGQKYLERIGSKYNDFKVDWSPNGQMVAQFNTGKDGTTSRIIFVGQHGENFRDITVNGYGVETKWTPDGSKLLYSAHNAYTDNKPLLHIVEAAGERVGYNHQSLNLNTWAYKCTFSNKDTAYCAVPKEMPRSANLIPELADDIADYIYKINLKTGVKSFVAEPEYGYSIDQLIVSENGKNLYFTDKVTQTVHSIRLK